MSGKGWMVREGGDALIFGYGPWRLANALHAAEALAADAPGIGVRGLSLCHG